MMKNRICLFGANGQTGVEILKKCIENSHPVTAAVRDRSSLKEYENKIDIVEYTFDDEASVKNALDNCDTAISVVGSGSHKEAAKPTSLYSSSIKVLLKCLQDSSMKRLIVISSAGVEYDEKAPWYFRYFFRPFLMNSYMDMMKMETILEEHASNIDWTIVRPTYLLDGESKKYLVKNRKIGMGNFKIHRVDTADFILQESQKNEWIHKYPVLGYE